MAKPTRQQIERAAAAVIRFDPPDGCSKWKVEFITKAKWPKDFYKDERAYARKLARAALEAALR